MAMVVNHNIPALMTYNTVNRTSSALEKSIQKLSTGLRINSAADDAAGLAISEKMRAQINGLDRATSNAQDGISMIQTAEGALNETHSILQRMRELSVQAANDTLTSQDRGYIQMEIDELREEVTRIGNTTQFNKKKLLNGDAAVLWSSSDLSTKAIINGGMRSIDQFGQKVVTEGNYNIKVKSEPGTGQVQKSDIFKIKHENVIMNKSVNGTAGVKDVSVQNVPAGSYKLKLPDDKAVADSAAVVLTGQYGFRDVSETTLKLEIADTDFKTGTAGALGLKVGTETIYVAYNNGPGEAKQDATTGLANTPTATGNTVAKLADEINKAVTAYKTAKGKLPPGVESIVASVGTGDDAGKLIITALNTSGEAAKLEVTDTKATEFPSATTTATAALNKTGGPEDPKAVAVNVEQLFGTTVKTPGELEANANVLFEVTNVDTTNNTVTLSAKGLLLYQDGTTQTVSQDNIVVGTDAISLDFLDSNKGNNYKTDGTLDASKAAVTMTLDKSLINTVQKGAKFTYNVSSVATTGDTSKNPDIDMTVQVSGTINNNWPESWEGGPTHGATLSYGLAGDKVAGKDVHFKNYYINEKTGEVSQGDIILTLESDFKTPAKGTTLASFDAAYVGQVAEGDVKLRDLDKFWTSEGVFMLDDPKTITITQGNGEQASVTLYATDTLDNVREKLNNAIASGLGQGQYVDDATKFVSFVGKNSAGGTSESVPGTFLIRTVIPGAEGSITFSGDENVINAFSLNTIQNATESKYIVDVEDAHDGSIVATGVRVTGNKLVGVIHPNVDVEFDSLTGVSAKWDGTRKAFVYDIQDTPKTTTLHLSDNTTVFQIGANEGEDLGVHIGDMRASALGIDRVNVTSREAASRSITILDNAIDKVSTQRAKLGAYQNRLEHTINNLTTASENITAAESRIRDTDMAKEMMNFTKLQIMLQAGNSMLAQANQLPQNVLSLIR